MALAAVIILLACAGYAGIHHGVTGEWPFVKGEMQQADVSSPQVPVEPALPASPQSSSEVADSGSPSGSEQERAAGQPLDQTISPTPTDADSEEAAPVPDDQLRVTIAATQKAWIQVWLDGKSAYVGTLSPGDTSEWTAKTVVKLLTGNAGGVTVTVDGKPQPALGRSGQVVTQSWRKTPAASTSVP